MLGKLIKHEFIQTSKRLTALYASAGAAMLLLMLAYLTKNMRVEALATFSLILIGFASIIMTYVMVIKNFNDSLYGSQGYLTFTLPVRSRDILFSKYLVSFIWVILSYIVMALGFVIIFVFFSAQATDNGIIGMLTGLTQSLSELGEIPSASLVKKALALNLIEKGIKYFSYVAFIFFALTISNTRPFQGSPLLFGTIIMFAVLIINWIATAVLNFVFPLSVSIFSDKVALTFASVRDGVDGALITNGIGGSLFTVCFSVLLLVVTGWIMEKKVNVK